MFKMGGVIYISRVKEFECVVSTLAPVISGITPWCELHSLSPTVYREGDAQALVNEDSVRE